jgi:endonuclease IV
MRDRRFQKIPKVLETPKGKDMHEDVINLRTLRQLAENQVPGSVT